MSVDTDVIGGSSVSYSTLMLERVQEILYIILCF